MIRKDSLFAVVTTFCLCVLVFAVFPIRSALPYDPWTDINEDGKINMMDVGNVAAQFGTLGDPTKNVNVTNWPSPKSEYEVISWRINITDYYATLPTYVGGYRFLWLSVQPRQASQGPFQCKLELRSVRWMMNLDGDASSVENTDFNISFTANSNGTFGWLWPDPYVIEVKGPYLMLYFEELVASMGSWVVFDVYAYCRN